MDQNRRKRLIEVAFPLEEVSAHSRHERTINQRHISTLHIWWARRPVAACRAFIYASLVDDPETDSEREELLKEVADLASWDAIRNPDSIVRQKSDGGSGLTGNQLLARARQRIVDCNDGKPPKLRDPFSGGGAIPLEALRLGCDVEASDLNPVAVLILKGTIEYPQRYGQPNSRCVPEYILQACQEGERGSFIRGDLYNSYLRNPLSTDVRYWGEWILSKAREDLAEFYPLDPDGSVPVAFLWSRAIPCPNCSAEMPLLRQYWLVRTSKRRVALEPILDRIRNRVDFRVVEGPEVSGNPSQATTSGGDTRCLLCSQVVKAAVIREWGRTNGFKDILTAVVTKTPKRTGKNYRSPNPQDLDNVLSAKGTLDDIFLRDAGELSPIPDEPINPDTLGLRIDALGFSNWGQLFNNRQSVALHAFSNLVQSAHDEMISLGMDTDYAQAVATYLSLAVGRLAVRNSNQCIYNAARETLENEIGRGVLPPVWDYVEGAPIFDSSGSWPICLSGIADVIESCVVSKSVPAVSLRDATKRGAFGTDETCVITDPPYYNAVDYAGLSDFFYVWLKRSLGSIDSELVKLPLTPKKRQAIMNSESDNNEEARKRYIKLMKSAFSNISSIQPSDQIAGIAFASISPDAWATLIESLLDANLVPWASWPIDTEMQSGMAKIGQARLKTSVWMCCRRREESSNVAFIGDVIQDMRPIIRERLLYFWSRGIRGADFFISAIGPALSVFGRQSRVLRPDGSEVSVKAFLDIVRTESSAVALEQVLGDTDLGAIDSITRQYLTWVWSYSKLPLESGEVIALCLATGASYNETVRPHSISVERRQRGKKIVRLRSIGQRATQDEELAYGSPAQPAVLINQLQYAAWLWGENLTSRLGEYRSQLGESRWSVLRTLGQAVAECLPEGDEDRRIILGLLGSNVRASASAESAPAQEAPTMLPGFDVEGNNG